MNLLVPSAASAHALSLGSVSYVIRTYNEAEFIGRMLEVLTAQQGLSGDTEIIIVDSGSTDNTVAIARQWPVSILKIPQVSFDYSDALNLGITNARGEFIVNISAHAIPSGNNWLATLVNHFADRSVAGVYCRQKPWPDAPAREVRRIHSEFGEQPIVYEPTGRQQRIPFTNSAGIIRRSLWEKHHFNLPWGEDFEWATWSVANGYKIVYEPAVWVYHSHNLTSRQAARRLINGEKASDKVMGRRRTIRLTTRQAAGHAYRDLKELLTLGDSEPHRFRAGCEALLRAYWFWRDFKG